MEAGLGRLKGEVTPFTLRSLLPRSTVGLRLSSKGSTLFGAFEPASGLEGIYGGGDSVGGVGGILLRLSPLQF